MGTIQVDKSKCVKCGLCAKDCIPFCIGMDEENYPQSVAPHRCINCGHCMAICPTGALSFDGKNPDDAAKTNTDDILSLIKSRRSVRQYTEAEISEENWAKIKEMLPFIPTGCNAHALQFSIIKNKDTMAKARNLIREKLLDAINNQADSPFGSKFAGYKSLLEQGVDVVFRGAPHMIIVSSKEDAPCADVDGIIALSYIELYAQELGLGTCWCGFGQMCIEMIPEFKAMLNIPEGYKPIYTILIGNPAVKYARVTQPEAYPIEEV